MQEAVWQAPALRPPLRCHLPRGRLQRLHPDRSCILSRPSHEVNQSMTPFQPPRAKHIPDFDRQSTGHHIKNLFGGGLRCTRSSCHAYHSQHFGHFPADWLWCDLSFSMFVMLKQEAALLLQASTPAHVEP